MIPIPKTNLAAVGRSDSNRILHIFEHESPSRETKRAALEKLISFGDMETLSRVIKNENTMDSMHVSVFLEAFESSPEILSNERVIAACVRFPALAFFLAGSDVVFESVPRETVSKFASSCLAPEFERNSEFAAGEILFRGLLAAEAFLDIAAKVRERGDGGTMSAPMFRKELFEAVERVLEEGDAERALLMLESFVAEDSSDERASETRAKIVGAMAASQLPTTKVAGL